MSSSLVDTSRDVRPNPKVPFGPLNISMTILMPNCLVLVTTVDNGVEDVVGGDEAKRKKRD